MEGKIARERSDQAREGLGGGIPLPGQGKFCIWQLKNKLCDAFCALINYCAFDIHVLLNRGNDCWKGKLRGSEATKGEEGLGGGVPLPGQENFAFGNSKISFVMHICAVISCALNFTPE